MRLSVLDRRRAGVLLHLSSLHAPLGRGGRAFVDWLSQAGFSVWQFLPLGPVGPDGSPYRVRSDFAGNPAFLDRSELPLTDSAEYGAFIESSGDWLEDYAMFESLSAAHGGAPWWEWPLEHRDREPSAMEQARSEHAANLQRVREEQFAFAVQWRRLREYAQARGVRFFGDLPFYVAPDSAETWAHRKQFQLDSRGRARAVAGVPPDYFSETGQLWGNPLYDWRAMRRDGFKFWRARIRGQLERVDLLRLDHFRALAAHWSVPAGAPEARGGKWCRTPGSALLHALRHDCGGGALPLVAEDLGVITPDVEALIKKFHLPGMRVLQFAFSGDSDNPHLPYMHVRESVVYTGTHDNDTTLGWFRSLNADTQYQVTSLLRALPADVVEVVIRTALGSVGRLAVIPMQDILALGAEARLNTPGTSAGNWGWRMPPNDPGPELAPRYLRLNRLYGRV
jgi:4-alpha-glucanotransferase